MLIQLDNTGNLLCHHKGVWTLAAVFNDNQSSKIKTTFFIKFEEMLTKNDGPISDLDIIQTPDAFYELSKFSKDVASFIIIWNLESIEKELMTALVHAKHDLEDKLIPTIDGPSLTEAAIKATELANVSTTTYGSRKHKKQKRCCCFFKS